MKKIILDTNAYVAIARGNNEIIELVQSVDKLYFSNFVMAELLYGFKNGNKEDFNRQKLDEFLITNDLPILQTTSETAEIFSDLKLTLKNQGTPIPIHDIWIAAQCIETGSILITLDKHFRNISGLRILPKF